MIVIIGNSHCTLQIRKRSLFSGAFCVKKIAVKLKKGGSPMCTFRCVECGCTYVVDEADSVSNSHGLCPRCLRLSLLKTFKSQQKKEGHHDCAGESRGFCSKDLCTYYTVCVKDVPTQADFAEVARRLVARRIAIHGRSGGYKHQEVMATAAG